MFFANQKGLAQCEKAGGKVVNGKVYTGILFAGRTEPWYASPDQLKGKVITDMSQVEEATQEQLDQVWAEIEGTELSVDEPTPEPETTTEAGLELPEDEEND